MDLLPRTVPVADLLTLRLTCNVCHSSIEAEPSILFAIYDAALAFQCCPTCSIKAGRGATPRAGFATSLKKLAEVLSEIQQTTNTLPDLQIEWVLPDSIRAAAKTEEKP
jgi:hypothetical protein